MSASDAYVEWWAVGVDPVMVVDRLLAAGLQLAIRPGSLLVDVLDPEGESVPTSLPDLRTSLRGADGRMTFQLWFRDGGNLIVSRRRVSGGHDGGVIDGVTWYLDALTPEEFDQIVGVAASLVHDFADATRVWVLDGSNDTAAFDWSPVAEGAAVGAPGAHVVVTAQGSKATVPGCEWVDDVPSPGLRATGWPVIEGGEPVSWYWWCRR